MYAKPALERLVSHAAIEINLGRARYTPLATTARGLTGGPWMKFMCRNGATGCTTRFFCAQANKLSSTSKHGSGVLFLLSVMSQTPQPPHAILLIAHVVVLRKGAGWVGNGCSLIIHDTQTRKHGAMPRNNVLGVHNNNVLRHDLPHKYLDLSERWLTLFPVQIWESLSQISKLVSMCC